MGKGACVSVDLYPNVGVPVVRRLAFDGFELLDQLVNG